MSWKDGGKDIKEGRDGEKDIRGLEGWRGQDRKIRRGGEKDVRGWKD